MKRMVDQKKHIWWIIIYRRRQFYPPPFNLLQFAICIYIYCQTTKQPQHLQTSAEKIANELKQECWKLAVGLLYSYVLIYQFRLWKLLGTVL